MTPSQYAKSIGLKNLKQVIEMTGVNRATLWNWQKHKPALFRLVLIGCLTESKRKNLTVSINGGEWDSEDIKELIEKINKGGK